MIGIKYALHDCLPISCQRLFVSTASCPSGDEAARAHPVTPEKPRSEQGQHGGTGTPHKGMNAEKRQTHRKRKSQNPR